MEIVGIRCCIFKRIVCDNLKLHEINSLISKLQTTLACHVEKTSSCTANCNATLPCGHVCPKQCHTKKDADHKEYKCTRQCDKSCRNGHACPMRHNCHLPCQPCKVPVHLTLSCGHKMKVTCKEQTGIEPLCFVKVMKELPCGHSQAVACHVKEGDHECTVVVDGCGGSCEMGEFDWVLGFRCFVYFV